MSLIKMILLLGLLIFVHELGHFAVARMFKMKVERFCFGLPFGPVIFEKKIGDITFGVHLLFFLGGYVSFPDDNKDSKLPSDSPDLFKNKPIYQRACVLLAGVTANLITAYVLVLLCCLHWHQLPSGQYDVYFKEFTPTASASALKSGIKEGDKFVSINGKNVEYYNELSLVASASKKFDNKITQKQYQKILATVLELNPDLNEQSILKKGQAVKLPKIIEEDGVVLSNNEIFGLKPDKTAIILTEEQQKLRIDAYRKTNYVVKGDVPLKTFVESISDTYAPINIVVERNGENIALKTIYPNNDGLIGATLSINEKIQKIDSFSSAIVNTQNYMARNTYLTLWGLKMMVTGKVSHDQVQGVVAIAKMGSDVIERQGLLKGFLLTALISLNLAILNILPIPVLDGGHLLFLAIEKVKGSPVNEKFIEIVSNIFFYILIIFMLLIVGNDIVSIITKKI